VTTPERELLELTRAARAWVEWHEETGADGLPGSPATLAPRAEEPRAAAGARPPARPPQAAPEAAPRRPAAASSAQPARAPARAAAGALPIPTAPFAGPPVVGAQRREQLRVLAEQVAGCTKCELHKTRTQTVFFRGNPDAELCFVGEGPGADEDAQGEPFVGKAGQLLDKMIAGMGMGRDDVYVANIVKCRPPGNRTPEAIEMATCMPYLTEQLDLVRPRVIVALGSTALRGLLGPGDGITKARGTWKLYRGTIPVMPTFHPAYVLRTPTQEVRGLVWSDLKLVLKQLGRELPKRG
jgi:DNA polymerase